MITNIALRGRNPLRACYFENFKAEFQTIVRVRVSLVKILFDSYVTNMPRKTPEKIGKAI